MKNNSPLTRRLIVHYFPDAIFWKKVGSADPKNFVCARTNLLQSARALKGASRACVGGHQVNIGTKGYRIFKNYFKWIDITLRGLQNTKGTIF